MCGIVGFNWDDKILLSKMMESIKHRGPDQKGVYIDENISLGSRRLSIIDLTKKGRQPIHNEDGSIWLIFNGEIYNYKEIRSDLEKKGHKFYSETDSEVIVHAYEEYGEECVKEFNGCFAFCIYDSNKKKLFLARDRLGIKPLYYFFDKERFIFASEIKAILIHDVKREINFNALHNFLSFRCNNLGETFFKGIFKLLPGHTLIFDYKNIFIGKYWDLVMNPENESENFYSKLLYKNLKESVEKRLMSDVPLGVYLSGGIDSSSIVALMSSLTDNSIKTFSVGYGLKDYVDELPKAKFAAEYFGTEHHEIIADEKCINLLPEIIWHLDEPIAVPSCIPTYLLSNHAKKYVTVVLTGEGADEQLAGYSRYKFMVLHDKYLRFSPLFIRKNLVNIIKIIPDNYLDRFFKYSSALGGQAIKRLSKFVATNNKAEMYLELLSIFDEEEKNELYTKYTKGRVKNNLIRELNRVFFENRGNILNNMLVFDNKVTLCDHILTKLDKTTMAASVEARVPFLDHMIVELAGRIPPRFKLKRSTEKYILKKTMKNNLPKQILKTEKEHFFVPIHILFKEELIDLAQEILSKRSIKKQGIFDYGYIEKIFKNFQKSRLYYCRQLWTLLTFQIWYKIYIENDYMGYLKYHLSRSI
jgi:asparagine synthase (glutamine-hydrolysing)